MRRLFVLVVLAALVTQAGAEEMVLRARMVDANGKPVTGAEVFLYVSPDVRRPADFISPKGGSDGRTELRVPAKQYHAVARLRSGDYYGPLGGSDRHSGDPLVIEPAPSQDLEFVLYDIREAAKRRQKSEIRVRKVRVSVVDADGKGVPEAYVTAATGKETGNLPAYVSAGADAEGKTVIHLPPGDYAVAGWRGFPPPGKAAGQKVVVGEGPEAALVIRLEPPAPSVPAGNAK